MNRPLAGSKGTVYHLIQTKPAELSEKDFAFGLNRARLDPRLMEVITEALRDFWWNLDPEELNKQIKKTKNPFMLKAALSAILAYCRIEPEDQNGFHKWVLLAIRGIKNPPPQLLYIGILPIGSKSMKLEVELALPCFKKMNLICKDIPFNKQIAGILRSEKNLPVNVLKDIDVIKINAARKIKNYKKQHHLTNDELGARLKINRVSISKILNNKTQGISAEYLVEKSAPL